MRRTFVLLALAALAGCADGETSQQMLWKRTDGQSGRGNPDLAAQFDADQATCIEKTRSIPSFWGSAASQVMNTCMADKGYILVSAQ